ncbi:replication protein [Rhodococcus sp. KBS0724]|uniref:replication protein n=1 Tax=Rhodococcus sp. KBS0724 TaxID=1179674 RepID=UPI00110E299C|nr:replication protein [Rhodococcus sp. KBS0724]TSD48603.1 replication protein [Rhodococcus sp. KBS0724]
MNNHIPTRPQGGIRRGPRQVDQFTIITNAVVNDRRLSFRARGVLIYLLSKPADWRTRSESIAAQSDKDGRDAVRSAMREMEAFGYLVRNRVQDDLGRWHMIQTIFENPLDTPGPDKSSTGGTDVEESVALPRIDLQRTETNQPSRKADPKSVVVNSPKIAKPNSEQLECVDELAAASQKAGLTATWRHLKPHNITAIAAHVETHGVPALVAHVKALHNPINPTRFASGWIPMWDEMPRVVAPLSWTSCGHCGPTGWLNDDPSLGRCQCWTRTHGANQ